jgi:hypothetical protein
MTGGQISGSASHYSGGGVYAGIGSVFSLGGAAVISGNVKGTGVLNNVYLANDSHITLSATAPPAFGMSVGVRTAKADGVIVESGASAGQAAYFFSDAGGGEVIFRNNQLVVTGLSAYVVNISGMDSGNYAAGETVAIRAERPPAGQRFKNWASAGSGVIFADAGSADTTFVMPAGAVRISANFESASSESASSGPARMEIEVRQSFSSGSYYFAPVELGGNEYRIVRRPGTLGGTAPMIDAYGRFSFGHQVMPVNISRAGEYEVRATDGSGVIYKITVR